MSVCECERVKVCKVLDCREVLIASLTEGRFRHKLVREVKKNKDREHNQSDVWENNPKPPSA